MRFLFSFFVLLVAIALSPMPSAADTMNIALVVNDKAVTEKDIADRTLLILASSGLPISRETIRNVRPQIVQGLIEEEIKRQEAERLELEITDEELESAFATISQNNNTTPEQFRQRLQSGGINIETLYNQLRAQIAWSKVVQREVRPRVRIRDSDAEIARQRIVDKIGTTEYLLAEILLPVDNSQDEAETRNLANRLVDDMRAGKAPFFQVARQFSKAAGAEQGGNLGWVQEGVLDPSLDQAVRGLDKNTFTQPIKTAQGYHIMFLRDKRTITEDIIPSVQQITQNLGLETLERQQRQYYLQLRSAAFIENR